MYDVVGGDFSYYDSILDWPNYNWDFTFIKISEGTVPDADFKQQWAAARGYTVRSPYHFFHAFVDVTRSIDVALSLMGNDAGELPMALDLEDDDGRDDVAEKALEWLGRYRFKTGRIPIVYTSKGFAERANVRLARYPEFADYPCWLAQYPWDNLEGNAGRDKVYRILKQSDPYTWPSPIAPWIKPPDFVQWTAICRPEWVPGYPLGHKQEVDVNFYRRGIKDLFDQFKIVFNPREENEPMPEDLPITWTAILRSNNPSNLRNAPGLVGTAIRKQLQYPVDTPVKGTGQKVYKDGFWWAQMTMPEQGYVALTTSYTSVNWNPTPTPPTEPVTEKIVRSVIHFESSDGTTRTEELFPKT